MTAQPSTQLLSKTYDETPYSSYPFSQTNPANLRAIGTLFGLKPPAVETARILEIGCASGNNILSIAARYPKSKCVGIDYSAKQIEEGQKILKQSGVKNLKLECASITDINKDFGEFDYIISHGVFSWIPVDIQKKLLEVSAQNLSKNGIAYVSYNTFPGWSAVYSIREMMLYHTAKYTDATTKVKQARALLKFISDSLKNNKSFYAQIINSEMDLLDKQSDYYLLHEHLEENNRPYYFHEFVQMANAEGLQYLGDVSLPSMYSGNLPEEAAKVLATADDIVRMEQYMDFINNRRFRSSLLCHKDIKLSRKLNPEDMADKLFAATFTLPENFNNYKYGSGENIVFKSPGGATLSSNDPLVIAAYTAIHNEHSRPISFKDIITKARKTLTDNKIQINGDDAQLMQALQTNILRSVFAGSISMHTDEALFTNKLSEKPVAFSLARRQAGYQNWVANMRQENITITEFDKQLLPLLDGKNTIASITEKILPLFKEGKLNIQRNQQTIKDEEEIKKLLPQQIANLVGRYAQLALLEK